MLFPNFPCPGIYSNVGLSLPNLFVDSHQNQKDPIKMQLFDLSFFVLWKDSLAAQLNSNPEEEFWLYVKMRTLTLVPV